MEKKYIVQNTVPLKENTHLRKHIESENIFCILQMFAAENW